MNQWRLGYLVILLVVILDLFSHLAQIMLELQLFFLTITGLPFLRDLLDVFIMNGLLLWLLGVERLVGLCLGRLF